jgi:hypothetical protein
MKNIDSLLIHLMLIIVLLMLAIMVTKHLNNHTKSSEIIGDAIQYSQQYGVE